MEEALVTVTIHPYRLRFKFPFRIAHGIRETTDVIYVQLQHRQHIAWGEAALPPYLPDTPLSVSRFIKTFCRQHHSATLQEWSAELKKVDYCMPGKAALDMALWSLNAQHQHLSISELLGIPPAPFPIATYTLGVSSLPEMMRKVQEAEQSGFECFKLKLTGTDDEQMIHHFRQLSDKPFAVDVNQGWKNADEALRKIEWLSTCGCMLVEQPLPVRLNHTMTHVKLHSELPVYADESCQRLNDIEALAEGFHGLNIKLMKSGGITEAAQMMDKARQLHLKVLLGCMSESSVGCTAAASLAPLADYADLDGPYLIANDPFEGMKVVNGRIRQYPLRQVLDTL